MTEPIRVSEFEVEREMIQFNQAMDTLGGFLHMMNPNRSKDIAIGRVRFYSRIFQLCMEQLDHEDLLELRAKKGEVLT